MLLRGWLCDVVMNKKLEYVNKLNTLNFLLIVHCDQFTKANNNNKKNNE